MWELDHKEGWLLKSWCFQTVVLEKTLESPLNYKEMKPVNLKRNQPWKFFGRTDVETEAPILLPPDGKGRPPGKGPNAGKDWSQEKWWERMRCLDGITDLVDMRLSKLLQITKDREAWCAAVHEVTTSQTRHKDWTTKWTTPRNTFLL